MDISPISYGFTGYESQTNNNKELSPADSKKVEDLKARDAEVRAHELAHLAAAGSLAMSGANFGYERGPDGVNYAVEGEVKIDTSEGLSPEETLRRAQTIQAAALAPVDPSAQDRAVAAEAVKMEAKARVELAELEKQEAIEAEAKKAQEVAKKHSEAENKDQNKQVNAIDFPVNNQPLPPAIQQYQAIFENQPAFNSSFHLAV